MIRNTSKLSNLSKGIQKSNQRSAIRQPKNGTRQKSKGTQSRNQNKLNISNISTNISTKSTLKIEQNLRKLSTDKQKNNSKQKQVRKRIQENKQNIDPTRKKTTSKPKSKDKTTKIHVYSTIKSIKQRVKQTFKNNRMIPKNNKSLQKSKSKSKQINKSVNEQKTSLNETSMEKRILLKHRNQSSNSKQFEIKICPQQMCMKKQEQNDIAQIPYSNQKQTEIQRLQASSSYKKTSENNMLFEDVKKEDLCKYIPVEIVREHKKVKFQDFTTLRLIAQESYYKQYLTLNRNTNCLFNIRVFDKRQIVEDQIQRQLQQSIKIHYFLSQTIYKYVQKIYTVFDDPLHIYIVLQPFLGQYISISYEDSLNQQKCINKENQVCFIFQNILHIVSEIHKHNIVLRNIGLSSIKKYMGSTVLTIVGRATQLTTKRFRSSFFGVAKEAPHEILWGRNYDYSYDMWSLGILLYELSTGLHPFSSQNQIQCIKEIQFQIPMLLSNKLVELISSLLVQRQKRMTIEQCLRHELINKQFMKKHLVFRDIWNFLSQ